FWCCLAIAMTTGKKYPASSVSQKTEVPTSAPVNLKAKIPRITAQTIIATLNTTFSFLSFSKWWTRRDSAAVPFQTQMLLSRPCPVQDLLLCAKHLFVAASRTARPKNDGATKQKAGVSLHPEFDRRGVQATNSGDAGLKTQSASGPVSKQL